MFFKKGRDGGGLAATETLVLNEDHNDDYSSQSQILLGWTLFVLFIVASFAEPYRTTLKDYRYDELYSALHASLSPLLFCIAFAWMIFIGENGPKSIGK
jgi:hypothetical protein